MANVTTWGARLSRRLRVAVLVGVTGLVGFAEVWAHARAGEHTSGWLVVIRAALLGASFGVPIVAAVTASQQLPIIGRRWREHLRAHAMVGAVTALGAALAESAARALAQRLTIGHTPGLVTEGFAWYTLWAVLAHAPVLASRVRRARAVRIQVLRTLERAGREQAATQLRAVRTDLHPVFITNALAGARALVHSDPAAAERVVVELGLLMHEAMAVATGDAVTLGEELDAAHERGIDRRSDHGRPPERLGPRAMRAIVDEEVRGVLVPHLLVPALLACAGPVGWDASEIVLRGRAVSLAGNSWLELDVVIATPTPAHSSRGPDAPDATTALTRLLDQFYRGGEPRWHFGTEIGADGVPHSRLHVPLLTDDQPVAAATGAVDPGERVFREWVVATTSDVAPTHWDAWAVAGLWALFVADQWSYTATLHSAGWTSGVVLAITGSLAGTQALVCAAAVAAARRWPVGATDQFGHAVSAHVAVGLAVAALATGIRIAAHHAVGSAGATNLAPLTTGGVFSRSIAAFVLYAVFVTVARLVTLSREHRRTAEIIAQARTAYRARADGRRSSKLRALKAELNPHFVGNALHTAAALVRSTPDAASGLLAALGALAREVGIRVDVQEVSLREEVVGLEPFLMLERARLGTAGGTLAVVWDIAPDVTEGAVPHLILQPLVENAVRHGLAPRGGSGRLTIRAHRDRAGLELSVVDDGVGLQSAPPAGRPGTGGVGGGAGLRGVRQRLWLLYGTASTCVLESSPSGGATARITLPYRIIALRDEPSHLRPVAGG